MRRLLISSLTVLSLAIPAQAHAGQQIQVVSRFDHFLEGLEFDRHGDLYVGVFDTGEIRRVDPDGSQTTIAQLDIGDGGLFGLADDGHGGILAALTTFDPATQGVWLVEPDGSARRLAATDPNGVLNAIAVAHDGAIYVSDSYLGTIWRIPPGGGTATAWVQDPTLMSPADGGFGANGIAFDHRGDLYVANTDRGTIVRIPVGPHDAPGTPQVVVSDPRLVGADGLAFDVRGRMYVTTSSGGNSLVRIDHGHIEVLAGGLDYPASIAFSTRPGERRELYIADDGGSFGKPAVVRTRVTSPGVRLP